MKTILTAMMFFLATAQNAKTQCNPTFNYTIATYSQSDVSFAGIATDTSITHTWFFGDGQQQNGKEVIHSYNFPGTYAIKHIVSDSISHCIDSSSQTITLNFTPNCYADFYIQYYTYTSSNPYSIFLVPNVSYSGSGIKSSAWTLNGQNIDSGYGYINQVSTNLQKGVNKICLNFTTNSGCSSSVCKTIITPVSCMDSLGFTTTKAVDNSYKLTFTANTDLPSLSYYWNFGDGETSTERKPTHVYSQAWTYPVLLSVRNTVINCLDTALQYITIASNAMDSCTASYSYMLNSEGKIFFTGQSNQPIFSQSWHIYKWGKLDTTLIAINPTYQLIDTGYYGVCLTLQTNNGCIRSSCNSIIVDSVSIPGGKSMVNSYPNPVNGSFVKIDFTSEDNSVIYYRVYSTMGNNVFQSQMQGHKGLNTINITVQSLNKGQYFVEIIIGNKKKRSIFQKL